LIPTKKSVNVDEPKLILWFVKTINHSRGHHDVKSVIWTSWTIMILPSWYLNSPEEGGWRIVHDTIRYHVLSIFWLLCEMSSPKFEKFGEWMSKEKVRILIFELFTKFWIFRLMNINFPVFKSIQKPNRKPVLIVITEPEPSIEEPKPEPNPNPKIFKNRTSNRTVF